MVTGHAPVKERLRAGWYSPAESQLLGHALLLLQRIGSEGRRPGACGRMRHTLEHGEGDQEVGEDGEEEVDDVGCDAPAYVHQLQHGVRLGRLVLELVRNHCTCMPAMSQGTCAGKVNLQHVSGLQTGPLWGPAEAGAPPNDSTIPAPLAAYLQGSSRNVYGLCSSLHCWSDDNQLLKCLSTIWIWGSPESSC